MDLWLGLLGVWQMAGVIPYPSHCSCFTKALRTMDFQHTVFICPSATQKDSVSKRMMNRKTGKGSLRG